MRSLSLFMTFALSGVFATAHADDAAKPLFNGKDFTGWKTKPTKAGAAGESLDAQTEAFKGRFKVQDGAIVIDGQKKGDAWIETARPIAGDATVRFEFNPGPTCNNDTLFRGIKFDLKTPDIKNLKPGEWNTFEIVLTGNKAEYRCNGESIKTVTTKQAASPFALRAERGAIQVRKVETISHK